MTERELAIAIGGAVSGGALGAALGLLFPEAARVSGAVGDGRAPGGGESLPVRDDSASFRWGGRIFAPHEELEPSRDPVRDKFFSEKLEAGKFPQYLRDAASAEGLWVGIWREPGGKLRLDSQFALLKRRAGPREFGIPPEGFTGAVQIPLSLPLVVELGEGVSQEEARRVWEQVREFAVRALAPIAIGRFATPEGYAPLAEARDPGAAFGTARNPILVGPGPAAGL